VRERLLVDLHGKLHGGLFDVLHGDLYGGVCQRLHRRMYVNLYGKLHGRLHELHGRLFGLHGVVFVDLLGGLHRYHDRWMWRQLSIDLHRHLCRELRE
jgi:hypothetical protein